MPELPETETIARDLDAEVRAAVVTGVTVTRADVLRGATAQTLRDAVSGMRIARVWRRAKCIVIDLQNGATSASLHLVVQPRFTGGLFIDDGTHERGELQYSTIAFDLDDGRRLHYRDVRRLGTVTPMSAAEFVDYSNTLGAEPLDESFSAGDLSAVLRATARPVKVVLMDQRRLAGVGNIYANEALWRAGIDPSRAANSLGDDETARLLQELRLVLTASIAARGTSFRDYRDARGQRGSFVGQLAAYGREGLPCQRCGRRLVGTHAIDGRATVFCATCQR